MAIITAGDLLKRVNNSNKVQEVLGKITDLMIDAADAGKTSVTTNLNDASTTNAIIRQLKKRGFKVATHYGATQLEISWAKESATDTSNVNDASTTDAICKDLEKVEAHYRDKAPDTQKCNECCVSVNGKPVDDPQPRKKPLPTPPSSTAPAQTGKPGVTVLKNGKLVNNNAQSQVSKPANQTQTPQKKNKRRRHHYNGNRCVFNNSVVFEKCTFNVTVNIEDIRISK